MESIRNAGKSSLITKLSDRVGEGRSVPVDNPSEVNVDPITVIGGKPVIEPVNTAGRVIVKNDDDFLLLDESVELIVGDECFQFVKDLRIVGLNALEKVDIGKQCFCKASGGAFEMRDCEKLKSVKIGDGSFVGVASVVFESECFDEVVME